MTMSHRIECFFDVSSPWTYLCVHNLPALARQFGAEIDWRPILVGGVFNAVNPSVYASRANPVPAKAAYTQKNLQDWAAHAGLKIMFPPSVFPVNAVKAMRACTWLQQDARMLSFATGCFEAYFGHDRDISQEAVLRDIAAELPDPIDGDALIAGIGEQSTKDRLRDTTDELVRRGGFGSPTLFIDGDDMYFGNDSLPLVARALARP